MSLEENKAIVRKVFEAINTKNLYLLDGIMAQDFIDRSEQFMAPLWKGFPDLRVAVEDIIAEGENVWVHVREVGTHMGEFRGLAPTGKKVSFVAIHKWHIVDGKIVKQESVYDFLDFLKQLGVIEYKGYPDKKR